MAKLLLMSSDTLLLDMIGEIKSETFNSKDPSRHVSRFVRAVLSQVCASKSVQLRFVPIPWRVRFNCKIVHSLSFTQSDQAAFWRLFSIFSLNCKACICALVARSKATWIAIFLKSDRFSGAKSWLLLFMKYLHCSGCGVLLHHQSMLEELLERAVEKVVEKRKNIMNKSLVFMAMIVSFLFLWFGYWGF